MKESKMNFLGYLKLKIVKLNESAELLSTVLSNLNLSELNNLEKQLNKYIENPNIELDTNFYKWVFKESLMFGDEILIRDNPLSMTEKNLLNRSYNDQSIKF
jgi:hypothetical protein